MVVGFQSRREVEAHLEARFGSVTGLLPTFTHSTTYFSRSLYSLDMGLLTIIRKNRFKEKEMRILFLWVLARLLELPSPPLPSSRLFRLTRASHSTFQRARQRWEDDDSQEAERRGYQDSQSDARLRDQDVRAQGVSSTLSCPPSFGPSIFTER